MAFVTVEEVATRLGWPLTPEEQARVQAFIDDCTVLIEEWTGKDFEPRVAETFSVFSDGSCFLKLPRRVLPHVTVTQVETTEEVVSGWVQLENSLYRDAGWPAGRLTVTGSWGYNPLPAVLKTATTAEVIRWMAQTPGLAMERTGEREVEYATSSSPQSLSEAACRALKRYRPSAGTITLRKEGCW